MIFAKLRQAWPIQTKSLGFPRLFYFLVRAASDGKLLVCASVRARRSHAWRRRESWRRSAGSGCPSPGISVAKKIS
jgi:hypothetical protein